jgi:hypothetical protein
MRIKLNICYMRTMHFQRKYWWGETLQDWKQMQWMSYKQPFLCWWTLYLRVTAIMGMYHHHDICFVFVSHWDLLLNWYGWTQILYYFYSSDLLIRLFRHHCNKNECIPSRAHNSSPRKAKIFWCKHHIYYDISGSFL